MAKAIGKAQESCKIKRKEKTTKKINESDEIEADDCLAPHGYNDEENLLEMEIPLPPPLLMSGDTSGQRLIISHLEVENFKSYYGKQTIGPFHKNFTAIIGPNGSGKSNVIDSLLFVFGYRASKIRSKKINVLIHSSAGKDNISSCTVSVFFKKIFDTKRDEMQVVEGSEFYVSRTAYRDNSSRYTLNGKTIHFKEIAKVLQSCGIDLIHNRFLILQGEVEQISLMKPKSQNENEEGMLEYLEDIIGSSRLKIPINKLLFKLGKLQEQRASQLLRLRHAEKEKLTLEKPAKAVVLKLRIDNAITIIHSKISALKKLALLDEIGELTPQHQALLEEFSELKKKADDLTVNLKQLNENHLKLQKSLDKKQESLVESNTQLREFKQKITKNKNDYKRFNEQLNNIANNIETETLKISELKSVPEKAQLKLTKLKSELEEIEKIIKINLITIEKKLPIVKEKTEVFREKHKTLDAELSKHIIVEDEIAANLAVAQEELCNLQREETTQRQILDNFIERLAQLEEDYAVKKKNLIFAERNLPELQKNVNNLKTEENFLSKKEADLNKNIRALRIKIEHFRQSEEKYHGTNRMINALLHQKQTGRIKGLYGRLGDLGAIDEKYDLAISTTCSALDNIVVDCVETAQLCIKFLQTENLGIASFIALDKQQHYWNKIRNKPKTPENASRLFDLIKVDDNNVLPAFYYALNDTLVADDITMATRISMSCNKRWRTVTLKGEVVEISGAMTGGGGVQKRGKIGQKVKIKTGENVEESNKNFDVLVKELELLETQLVEVRQNFVEVQKNHRNSQTDLAKAIAFEKNLKTDVDILSKNIDNLKKQLNSQKVKVKEVTVNPKIIEKNSKKIKDFQQESDRIGKITNSLRVKLIELLEKIDHINNEIVGTYQTALREAETRKEIIEKSISKENNSIMSNERNLKKVSARLNDFKSDYKQVEEKIKQFNINKNNFEDELNHLNSIISTQQIEIDEVEQKYNESTELLKQLNNDETTFTKRLTDLQDKIQKIQQRLEFCKTQISIIDKQVSKLKLFRFEHISKDLLECEEDNSLLQNSLLDNSNLEDNNDENFVEEENEELNLTNLTENNAEINEKETNEKLLSQIKMGKSSKVPIYSEEKLRSLDHSLLEKQLKFLEDCKSEQKKENINVGLLMDYMHRVSVFNDETKQFQNISKQRDLHLDFCESLKKQRLQEFMEGFQMINERLKEMYQMITLGGDASLDLVDSLDPFSEGVSFGVRPPKKSWKQITNLSGGEKTLASLALVFGLHHYRPTPLYVMDEIDAALDFRNVSIISNYILERTKNAQFIVISLRNNMFERGDRIIGIYKVYDCTHNVVLDPKKAEKQFKKDLKALKYNSSILNPLNNNKFNANTMDDNVSPTLNSTLQNKLPLKISKRKLFDNEVHTKKKPEIVVE